jgi:hypothetical protein
MGLAIQVCVDLLEQIQSCTQHLRMIINPHTSTIQQAATHFLGQRAIASHNVQVAAWIWNKDNQGADLGARPRDKRRRKEEENEECEDERSTVMKIGKKDIVMR